MKGNKNRELKKRLERELPYPRLTVQADLRFDQILAALPERETLQATARAEAQKRRISRGPAHYKKETEKKKGAAAVPPEGMELSEGLEYFEPVPFRRSWPKTVFQCAAAFAVFCLVCLALLNVSSPEIAESLPGFGGLFQTINGSLRPAPTAEPPASLSELPAKTPYTITVESAVRKENYLFQTVRLDFTEESCPATDQLFTALNGESGIEVAIEGHSALLYRDPVFERIPGETAFRGSVISVLNGEVSNEGILTINQLLGVTAGKERTALDEPDISISQAASCPISAYSEYCYNNFDNDAPMVMNNVALRDYTSTESEFSVNISYPTMNSAISPYVTARPADDGLLEVFSVDIYGEGGELGDIMGQKIGFEAVPEGTRQVFVTVYTQEPEYLSVYVDGSMLGAAVLAEFCIDLESGEITGSTAWRGSGVDFVQLPYYAEVWEAGFRFHDHVLPLGWERAIANFSEDFSEAKCLSLGVLSDLDLDLPLQLETYLYGELIEELPLYRQEDSIELGDGVYRNEGKHGWIDVISKEEDILGSRTVRQYEISLFAPGIDPLSWNLDPDGYCVILRNLKTGEALAGSKIEENPGDIHANMELIGTQAELLWERPVFYDPGKPAEEDNGMGSESEAAPSPTPFPEDQSIDDIAASSISTE